MIISGIIFFLFILRLNRRSYIKKNYFKSEGLILDYLRNGEMERNLEYFDEKGMLQEKKDIILSAGFSGLVDVYINKNKKNKIIFYGKNFFIKYFIEINLFLFFVMSVIFYIKEYFLEKLT